MTFYNECDIIYTQNKSNDKQKEAKMNYLEFGKMTCDLQDIIRQINAAYCTGANQKTMIKDFEKLIIECSEKSVSFIHTKDYNPQRDKIRILSADFVGEPLSVGKFDDTTDSYIIY